MLIGRLNLFMLQNKFLMEQKIIVFLISIFVLTGIGIFILTPKAKAASPGDVVINEIMWTGSSATSTDEWIELRNTSSAPIDVANWKIKNATHGATTTLLISPSDCSTTTIPANGYFLVSNYASSSPNSLLNVSPQCTTSSLDLIDDYSLNGALVLEDGSGSMIDQTPASSTTAWPAGSQKTATSSATSSMARNYNPGDGANVANWHTSIIATGWDAGAQEKGTPGGYNGYPVSGTISQLNATTSGPVYIIVREHASSTNDLARYYQATTGPCQLYLLDSTQASPNGKYDFFAFRDINRNGNYDHEYDVDNFLNNNNDGYSLTNAGLSNLDFKMAVSPIISAVSPSTTHIGDTITISGSRFGSSATTSEGKVFFWGGPNLEGQVSSWSSTSIQVVVPQLAQTGDIRVNLGGWAQSTSSLAIKPKIVSALATEKSVKLVFDSFMDGASASDLANYTLYSPTSTQIDLSSAWTEFRGREVYIKGISLTLGDYFRINPSANIKGDSGTVLDADYYATGTVIASPEISYVYKKGQATSTNFGNVGDTVVIVGSNFGSATGTVYFAPGPPTEGQPQEPIFATSSLWTATSIEAVIPEGARTGPVFVSSADGIESDFSQNAFFNVLTNVNYKILDPNGNSISTSTARIVIGSMGGPVLHYVGDGNLNSSTTYDAVSKVYTVHNVPSEGFNWAFDSSGAYSIARGQELNSSATTTFILATSTTKISGNISNARASSTIVVWSDPIEGTGENMERHEPVFVKTDANGAAAYNIGLSATGTYMVGVEDPGFGGGASSNPKIAPSNQRVSATTTSGVSGINFGFVSATRRIRGKVAKAANQSFDIGPGVGEFHVYAYQPKEGGLHASAKPDSSGYFDLYVNPGVYVVGVSGPNIPSAVEKKIEVLASDSNFATSNTAVDINLVIEAPDEYIEGQVTDSNGNGVSGASIFAWSSTGPGGGQAFTNSAGYYKLYLSPGSYNLDGFAPNFGKLSQRNGVTISDGCSDSNTCPVVDFGVSSELATISGNVKKNNASSSDMEVWVTQGDLGYGINRTKTDSNGNYVLKVPYGSGYYLHVAQPGIGEIYKSALPDFSSIATSTTVNISRNTAIIYVQISPKSAFSDAFIEAYGSQGRGFSDKDISSASDAYREYAIEVPEPTSSGAYSYSIRGGILGYGPLPATTTVVTSTTVSKTISYNITSNVGTISGSVSFSGTGTSTDAYVWAANSSGHTGEQVDSSGNFSFKVKAGTYDVGIDKPGYIGSVTTSITVTAGAITTVNGLALTRAGSEISGTVYKSGVAESGAWVWATNGAGGWVGDETDGNGAFTLEVNSGDWTIKSVAEGYESEPVNVSAGTTGISISLTNAIPGYTSESPTVAPIVPKTGGVIQGSNVKIEAPEGALDAQDTNTGYVSIQKTTSIPKSNDTKALGDIAYDISVSNASGTPITVLNDSITISLTYSPSDLTSAGITQAEALGLSLGYFDTTLNKWVVIPTNVATTSNGGVIFTGTAQHLTDIAPIESSGANPPPVPTGLVATAGDGQVSLSWIASSGATKYNIYRKSGSDYLYLTQTANTSYTNTGLSNGTTYYYKISALNSDNDESAATAVVSATPVAPPSSGGGGAVSISSLGDTTPPSISNISVMVSSTGAVITWQTSELSLGWLIYGTSTNYGFEKKENSLLTSHSVALNNLLPETSYHYKIESKDDSGNIGVYPDKVFTTLALGQLPEQAAETANEMPTVTFEKPISQMTADEIKSKIEEITAALERLKSLLAEMTSAQKIEGIEAGFSFRRNLKFGDYSIDVKYLQIVLNSDPETKLADSGAGSPGNETEYFGPLTKKAVIKFQNKYASEILSPWGLINGTGFVGRTTREKLNGFLE